MVSAAQRPLAGRVALVTGANTGIGRVTARELAARGAHVFMACRSAERAQPVIAEIRAAGGTVDYLALDLGDFASVRACAESFLARDLPLHLLINNAGLAGARGFTPSGFELAFGTNHAGHFLLTRLLLDAVRRAAPARIVTVASDGHYHAPGIDWDAVRKPTRTRSGMREYTISKLANVLFSAELSRRLDGSGVTTHALHPGLVASDVWRFVPRMLRDLIKLAMISPEQGAQTTLYCATSGETAGQTGLYCDRGKIRKPSRLAQDRALAAELWRRSEEWAT
ncbi:MAG: SDR family oxidoreductase [Proteobacteria bacterium]|nr:SDR family oxidoreductase [Pseudomonadota bacterium]